MRFISVQQILQFRIFSCQFAREHEVVRETCINLHQSINAAVKVLQIFVHTVYAITFGMVEKVNGETIDSADFVSRAREYYRQTF